MMFSKLLLIILLLGIGHAKDNIVIYHAYGNNHQVIVQGRMERERDFKTVSNDDGWLRNLWRRLKQVKADDIKRANINLSINDESFKTKGDSEGYFEFNATTKQTLHMGYQKISLQIEGNKYLHEANASIFDTTPLLGIISDFDDTLIISDVTHKIKLGLNTMFKNYKQRTVVSTMLERFTKILRQNLKGTPSTLFILTGSPQQLFTPIEQFLDYHHFPKHTLILKKAHGDNQDPLTDQFAYKTQKIERLIKLYPNMKWIMFGDSGEKDAEVYKAMQEKYPHRVIRYYIRDVDSGKIKEYNHL